jgi:hypothetical protein
MDTQVDASPDSSKEPAIIRNWDICVKAFWQIVGAPFIVASYCIRNFEFEGLFGCLNDVYSQYVTIYEQTKVCFTRP